MPSKKKGGKRIRRGKKNADDESKRTLEFAEDGQQYAYVIRRLGGPHLEVEMPDNSKKMAYIRGKFRKRVWINAGDVLIVGERDFQNDKVDVMHKYNPDEVAKLVSYEEIPSGWADTSNTDGGDGDKSDTLFVYENDIPPQTNNRGMPSSSSEDDDMADKKVEDILGLL